MNQQDFKVVQLIADMTVDNTAFTTTEIDTKGYAKMAIIASFGNVPATVASMTVTQSDTTGSNHTAYITVGTTTDIAGATTVLPTAADGDGKSLLFHVNLDGKKRYHDLTVTAGNGSGTVTECSAIAILYNGSDAPVSATERGVSHVVVA